MAELGTVALALLLMATTGIMAVRLGMPPAIGYLGAGIIAASTLDGVLPEHGIESLAEIGVLVLLFFIGLELDLKRLRRALKSTAWTIPFDIAVPGLAAAALARLAGWSFTEAIALGMAMSISSTLFGERLTSSPGTERGTRERVFGVLVSEDLAAAGLLAMILVLADGGGFVEPLAAIGRLGFFLILLTAGALYIIPRILDEVARRHVPEVLVLWAAGLVALFGYLGFLIGSPELGALVAGVAAAEAGSRYVVRNTLSGIRDLAAAVFFLASGLAVNLGEILHWWPLCVAIAMVFIASKLMVHIPAAIGSNMTLRSALQTGLALTTVGEFSLILAAVAVDSGVAHEAMRTVAVGTMIILLPASAIMYRTAPKIEKQFWQMPQRIRRPIIWVGQSIRSKTGPAPERGPWQSSARLLAVNALLLAGWTILATFLSPRIQSRLEGWPIPSAGIWIGLAVAISLPLLRGVFRHYRRLVWHLVGLRRGEREGAGKVRARMVDTVVVLVFVLALLAASLRYPQTLPVVGAGAAIAIIVGALAWRTLNRFHVGLEQTLGRVLGHETENAQLLDSIIDRYPWGVKFAAVIVPPGSPVAMRSMLDSRISQLSGAMVAVLQRGRHETVNPAPDVIIRPGDTLVMLGDLHQLSRAEALVVSHGDAIRMTAQSSAAIVEELVVKAESPWAGKTMQESGIRAATGTLVVGLWAGETRHPLPYRPEARLSAGDRLILLGTPLQIERARIHTEGIPEAQPEA